MFMEVLVIAVITGLILGGRLANLGRLKFRYIYVIIIAYLIQVGLDFWGPRQAFWGYPYLHVLSYVLLVFALVKNLKLPGINYILGGTVMNFIVIVLNGGLMPVRADVIPQHLAKALATGHGGTHVLMTEGTRLAFLADIFYISLPYQHSLISMGDIIINAGILVLIVKGMKRG